MRKPERGAALIDHLASYRPAPVKTGCHHSGIMKTSASPKSSWIQAFGNPAGVFVDARINLVAAERGLVLARHAIPRATGLMPAGPSGNQTRTEFPSHFKPQEQMNG